MAGELIVKGHDAQEAPAKFGRSGPKAETIMLLRLAADRVLNDA